MIFDAKGGKRQRSRTDETQSIGLVRLNIDDGETRIARDAGENASALAVDENVARLSQRNWTVHYIRLDLCHGRIHDIGEHDDSLLVVVVWRTPLVLDDQRAISRNGLEADVAVVVVGTGHPLGDVDFVVEEMQGRDGPLTGHGRAVAERGDGHGEAVPVLHKKKVNLTPIIVQILYSSR